MGSILIKINHYIKAAGIFTDVLYNTIFRLDAVSGGKAAGHGDGRVDNVAIAAGPIPLNNLYRGLQGRDAPF